MSLSNKINITSGKNMTSKLGNSDRIIAINIAVLHKNPEFS
jgi:hypothetical protein